ANFGGQCAERCHHLHDRHPDRRGVARPCSRARRRRRSTHECSRIGCVRASTMTESGPKVHGERLGRYTLDEEIHAGSMSRVYRAHDTESGQVVALKRPVNDDAGSLARFFTEARIHQQLNHPAIVRQLAHGGTSFTDVYLAMEWLHGQTLDERLATGPLGLSDALALARQTAAALSFVHREQFVHRDLKPANLLLVDDLPAKSKLID